MRIAQPSPRIHLLNSQNITPNQSEYANNLMKIMRKLTVRFPKFFTLQMRCTVLPTSPVTLGGRLVSKYGPVPGVGYSCRKSVRNRFELLVLGSASKIKQINNKERKISIKNSGLGLRRVVRRVQALTHAYTEKKSF